MKPRRGRALAILLFAAGLPCCSSTATRADDAADRQLCGNADASTGPGRVDACSRLLASTSLGPADRARLLAQRAAAQDAQGDPDDALADLDEAIRLDGTEVDHLRQRADLKRSAGDADGAADDYGLALAAKPDDLPTLRARANLLMQQGRDADVLRDLDAILRLDPDDGQAYNDRALARWRDIHTRPAPTGGTDDGGFAGLQRQVCLELHPDCPDVALALSDLGHAIALIGGPDRALPLIDRGNILAEGGDYAGALADYDEAVRLKPDDVVYRIRRAALRQLAGDLPGAQQDLDEALRLKPGEAPILVQRAKVRQQAGDTDGARRDLDDALQQPGVAGASAWFDEAHRLRRAIAKPGEPGFERQIDGLAIGGAEATHDEHTGQPVVMISFEAEAARRLAAFTTAHVGSQTEILLNGQVITAPRILVPITNGTVMLTGSFTAGTAQSLALKLREPGTSLTVRAVD